MASSGEYYSSDPDMDMSDSAEPIMQDELQREKRKNARLLAQVEEYKSQLMELASEDDQISDLTIQTSYERLLQNVERWVDDVLVEDPGPSFQVWQKVMKSGKQRVTKILSPSLDADLDRQTSYEAQRLHRLGPRKNFNCLIVSLAIWRFLEHQVFERPFPIGTSSDERKNPEPSLLQSIFDYLTENRGLEGMCICLAHIEKFSRTALTAIRRWSGHRSPMDGRNVDCHDVHRAIPRST
jgi:hypothetical protein